MTRKCTVTVAYDVELYDIPGGESENENDAELYILDKVISHCLECEDVIDYSVVETKVSPSVEFDGGENTDWITLGDIMSEGLDKPRSNR